MSELLAVIDGELAARVRADKSGRLSLEYESGWRRLRTSHSLSLSMPLSGATCPHRPVWAYLWNLLPEDPNVLRRWGRQYQVSPANPFKLLAHVGADVPGAAQFIPPEGLQEIRSTKKPAIEWIGISELAERLRQLSADAAAVRRLSDIGRVSLPGAQAKSAYFW
ncbi:MAG: HipA N-terminal domain-containing protein, partial [Acetobacteraceae bacterium]